MFIFNHRDAMYPARSPRLTRRSRRGKLKRKRRERNEEKCEEKKRRVRFSPDGRKDGHTQARTHVPARLPRLEDSERKKYDPVSASRNIGAIITCNYSDQQWHRAQARPRIHLLTVTNQLSLSLSSSLPSDRNWRLPGTDKKGNLHFTGESSSRSARQIMIHDFGRKYSDSRWCPPRLYSDICTAIQSELISVELCRSEVSCTLMKI